MSCVDRPSRSHHEQFRTQGFLRIESTAVQRYDRKSTEIASGSKIVGENRGEMQKYLSCAGFYAQRVLLNISVVHMSIDLHVLTMNNFEHRVLRIEPINTAV